jgi:adhesin/invasin
MLAGVGGGGGLVGSVLLVGARPAAAALAPVTKTATVTFSATGAQQTFTVPSGVTSLQVTAVGAPGAGTDTNSDSNSGGLGATVSGTVTVTAGETLDVEVGTPGSGSGTGGFNGGGSGGQGIEPGGGGGGASSVQTCSGTVATCPTASLLVVAAGGGGAGNVGGGDSGQGGGGNAGASGAQVSDVRGTAYGGGPGTSTAGGAGGTTSGATNGSSGAAGGQGAGGAGAFTPNYFAGGGGGGGGLYGGGGGATNGYDAAGGGGGSSLVPTGGTEAVATTSTPSVSFTYTYTYTPTTTWVDVAPSGTAGGPPPAMGSAMATDPATGDELLFGGFDNPNDTTDGTVVGGTWSWNDTAWSALSPATSPSPRAFAQMATDPATGQVVLMGGQDGTTFYGGTYVYAHGTWTKVLSASTTDTATTPSERAFGAMAWDPASAQLVLFGGQDQATAYGGTWVWNGTSDTWQQVEAAATNGTTPPARYGAAMAYDPALGELVLFGGTSGTPGGAMNDTWAWNGTAWHQLTVTGSTPSARFGATMSYDPALGELVLFGGTVEDASGTISMDGDTWTFDGTSWSELNPGAAPSARYGAAGAYDATSQQLLLFGGSTNAASIAPSVFAGGTWSFESPPGQPTAVEATAGDTTATVSWIAPPDGGSPVTSYTVTPSPACSTCGGLTVTGNPPATSTTVTGLTNGTAYTFTVTAVTAVGTGSPSAASASVVPEVPVVTPPGEATVTGFGPSDVSPTSPVSGQPVTLTATVTTEAGQTVTAGNVAFESVGGGAPTPLCAASVGSGGTASCQTTLSASGSPYTIVALYSGAPASSASPETAPSESSTVTVAVAPAASGSTPSSGGQPSAPRQPAGSSSAYLAVGAHGGVYAFGGAPFAGSLPGVGVVTSSVVGMAAAPGGGYWLVGRDGGVFAFGSAGFSGSLPGAGVSVDDVVGILGG